MLKLIGLALKWGPQIAGLALGWKGQLLLALGNGGLATVAAPVLEAVTLIVKILGKLLELLAGLVVDLAKTREGVMVLSLVIIVAVGYGSKWHWSRIGYADGFEAGRTIGLAANVNTKVQQGIRAACPPGGVPAGR